MSFRFIALPLITLPFISTTILADSTELDSMVVTASRTAMSADRLLASVSVVTRQDIERYNYQSLAEAISSLPGVDIANNGGLGKLTSLFIRGTESNHTQILLNGVKLATSEFGAPQLEHIPLEHIERIELVRGPQSSLYGSESIGGTIQIFTKQGGSKKLTPALSVSYGTHSTQAANFSVSGGNEKTWFNLGAGYKQSDGFNSCDGRSGTLFIGCFVTEPDNDAYRNQNLSIHVGHRFTEQTNIELFSLYSEGENEFDGSAFFGNQTDFLQHTYGIRLNTAITDNWSITSSLSQGKVESENNKDGVDINFADNQKNYFSLQNDIQLNSDMLLTLGFDYENDKLDTTGTYDEDERDNKAYFSQLLGKFGNSDYRLALRVDDNEQFGNHTTGNLALGHQISNSLRVYGSYGTAYTAPSFVDLYSPFGANQNLSPEESRSYEIGLSGQHFDMDWSLAIYRTQINNFISLDSLFIPQNISEARIRGIELTAATQIAGIELDGQLTLAEPENRSSDNNAGNVLARRAEHSFNLNAYKSFGSFDLATKLYTVGRRFDDAANTRRLAPYTTVDLVGSYQIVKDLRLQLKVTNLFNQEYEAVSGYNTDGPNFLMSLHYRP
jgi:vitamin B12 transporter